MSVCSEICDELISVYGSSYPEYKMKAEASGREPMSESSWQDSVRMFRQGIKGTYLEKDYKNSFVSEFQIVHYLIPDTWELEELFPDGDVCLVESDISAKSEFDKILQSRKLKFGKSKEPFNNKMELFEAERE